MRKSRAVEIMQYPREIEERTVKFWLSIGTLTIEEYGEENTYYCDQFGNKFYCKNYPREL